MTYRPDDPDPRRTVARTPGPDDATIGRIVRDVADGWTMPPRRIGIATWRERVDGTAARRRRSPSRLWLDAALRHRGDGRGRRNAGPRPRGRVADGSPGRVHRQGAARDEPASPARWQRPARWRLPSSPPPRSGQPAGRHADAGGERAARLRPVRFEARRPRSSPGSAAHMARSTSRPARFAAISFRARHGGVRCSARPTGVSSASASAGPRRTASMGRSSSTFAGWPPTARRPSGSPVASLVGDADPGDAPSDDWTGCCRGCRPGRRRSYRIRRVGLPAAVRSGTSASMSSISLAGPSSRPCGCRTGRRSMVANRSTSCRARPASRRTAHI